jgi:hypothetical protein
MPRARLLGLGSLVPILVLAAAATQAVPTIFDAVLGKAGQPTAEVSTEELRRNVSFFAGSLEEARALPSSRDPQPQRGKGRWRWSGAGSVPHNGKSQ